MTQLSSVVDTRTEVLIVQVPGGVGRLRDLITILATISELHTISWKLSVGLEMLVSPPENFSPATSPFPPTAPDLRVEYIEQGSLIVHLMADLSSRTGLGIDAAGASGALWLLYRLLQRGPRTLAQFVAEVLSTRTMASTRRMQIRRERALAETEEAIALKPEARIKQWLAQDQENQVWLRYQALVNAAPDLQVKMIDQEGRDLAEPSSPE